jgi:hypothetical protein
MTVGLVYREYAHDLFVRPGYTSQVTAGDRFTKQPRDNSDLQPPERTTTNRLSERDIRLAENSTRIDLGGETYLRAVNQNHVQTLWAAEKIREARKFQDYEGGDGTRGDSVGQNRITSSGAGTETRHADRHEDFEGGEYRLQYSQRTESATLVQRDRSFEVTADLQFQVNATVMDKEPFLDTKESEGPRSLMDMEYRSGTRREVEPYFRNSDPSSDNPVYYRDHTRPALDLSGPNVNPDPLEALKIKDRGLAAAGVEALNDSLLPPHPFPDLPGRIPAAPDVPAGGGSPPIGIQIDRGNQSVHSDSAGYPAGRKAGLMVTAEDAESPSSSDDNPYLTANLDFSVDTLYLQNNIVFPDREIHTFDRNLLAQSRDFTHYNLRNIQLDHQAKVVGQVDTQVYALALPPTPLNLESAQTRQDMLPDKPLSNERPFTTYHTVNPVLLNVRENSQPSVHSVVGSHEDISTYPLAPIPSRVNYFPFGDELDLDKTYYTPETLPFNHVTRVTNDNPFDHRSHYQTMVTARDVPATPEKTVQEFHNDQTTTNVAKQPENERTQKITENQLYGRDDPRIQEVVTLKEIRQNDRFEKDVVYQEGQHTPPIEKKRMDLTPIQIQKSSLEALVWGWQHKT